MRSETVTGTGVAALAGGMLLMSALLSQASHTGACIGSCVLLLCCRYLQMGPGCQGASVTAQGAADAAAV